MGRCPLSIFCSRGTPPSESIRVYKSGLQEVVQKQQTLIESSRSRGARNLFRTPPSLRSRSNPQTQTPNPECGSSRPDLLLLVLSSHTKVYSVMYDSGSVPEHSIFSPRGTSPEANQP